MCIVIVLPLDKIVSESGSSVFFAEQVFLRDYKSLHKIQIPFQLRRLMQQKAAPYMRTHVYTLYRRPPMAGTPLEP